MTRLQSTSGTSFDAACSLVESLLEGTVRQEIVADLARSGDFGQALRRLRDCMRANTWHAGARRIKLDRIVRRFDACTRREGFHALHDWDGIADRVNAIQPQADFALAIRAEVNTLFEAGQTQIAVAIDTDNDPETGGGEWPGLGISSAGWASGSIPIRPLHSPATIRSSIVFSTNFTSAGEALSVRKARGRPWPSAIPMILVPLPRLVFPTKRPLFWPEQTFRPQSIL